MRVRVVKVGSIPFGLSALVDERPGSLVVWLREVDWPEPTTGLLESVLTAMYATQGELASVAGSGMPTV